MVHCLSPLFTEALTIDDNCQEKWWCPKKYRRKNKDTAKKKKCCHSKTQVLFKDKETMSKKKGEHGTSGDNTAAKQLWQEMTGSKIYSQHTLFLLLKNILSRFKPWHILWWGCARMSAHFSCGSERERFLFLAPIAICATTMWTPGPPWICFLCSASSR